MTEKRKTRKTEQNIPESVVDESLQEGEASASVEPVQLTIADLNGLAAVVDLASRRGAFQANELTQVGTYYNKLSAFLEYVKSQQEEVAEDTEESVDAVEDQVEE